MATPQSLDDGKFVTCTIHLSKFFPDAIAVGDPPGLHPQEQAINKIHHFCHAVYQVPITWLCSYPILEGKGELLASFHRAYGDEVAIMESGISSRESLRGQVKEYQGWVEECGLTRPGEGFKSRETEARGQSVHDMGYEEQEIALRYLKKRYDEVIGQDTKTLACPHGNEHTIRAMKDVGLGALWGYCWNYFCEGINHKGSLWAPFYISDRNQAVPEQYPSECKVLSLPWGPHSPVMGEVETHCRMGLPGYCLNSLEMTNRSDGLAKYRYHEKVITEVLEHSAWNRYSLAPLQLEAIWLDEGEISEEYYDQYPTFNPANTETFMTQIETALRCGAKPVTISGFADWHATDVQDTPPTITWSEDHLPDLRSKGKDQAYPPMVIYGSKTHQYFFRKSHGFNYVRRYTYNPVIDGESIGTEYPFDNEPKVYREIKRSTNVNAGILLTPEGACYELIDFDLTAYHDDPDYAAIIWQANIPPYIHDEDIEIGGVIKDFKVVREKNIAIFFADLNEGFNEVQFRSNLPNQHVQIQSVEKVGRRYEIWIANDADEVRLHTLRAVLEPGLRIGGFWWDGFYNRTIFRYGWGSYNRHTGSFELQVHYPVTMKVNHGLTRVSVELL